jgi:hypothetical protein
VVTAVANPPAIYTQQLFFAGKPLLFKTNSPAVACYAADFLAETPAEDMPEQTALAKIVVMVRESDNYDAVSTPWFRGRGHFASARFTPADAFWFNLRTREAYGHFSSSLVHDPVRWSTHVFPAVLGILSASLDIAPVHAACLARDAHGVLLAGHSGAGKSTLAISLAKLGYALLSDDWTYLSVAEANISAPQVDAWGIPVPVKLLPDACNFFPELLRHNLSLSLNGEIAYEVNPNDCFGIMRTMRTPVTSIVLLQRSETPGCRVIPVHSGEAIDHLAREIEPLSGPLASLYENQIALLYNLKRARSYRVEFNCHPDIVAEAIDRTLFSVN